MFSVLIGLFLFFGNFIIIKFAQCFYNSYENYGKMQYLNTDEELHADKNRGVKVHVSVFLL